MNGDRLGAVDPQAVVTGPDPERGAPILKTEGERLPCRGQAGLDRQDPSGQRAQSGEAAGEGLPEPAEGGEMQPAGGGPGEVVEVEAGRQAEQLQGGLGLPVARQQRGMNSRGKGAD